MSLRSHPTVLRTIERTRDIAERLIAVRVVETSIVLAAQAFLALFPLILVVASVAPHDVSTGLLNELRSRLGVSGGSAGALQSLLNDRSALQQSLSVISFVLVIGSATAFTRALQRMYQNAWGLPKLGLRGLWRGFAWLIGLVAYLGILGTIAHVIHHGGVLAPLSTVLGFGLWWWTPFLLLGGRVRARALIPAAVIITAAQLITGLVSSAIVPRTIRNNESNYGPIGAVFAFDHRVEFGPRFAELAIERAAQQGFVFGDDGGGHGAATSAFAARADVAGSVIVAATPSGALATTASAARSP